MDRPQTKIKLKFANFPHKNDMLSKGMGTKIKLELAKFSHKMSWSRTTSKQEYTKIKFKIDKFYIK